MLNQNFTKSTVTNTSVSPTLPELRYQKRDVEALVTELKRELNKKKFSIENEGKIDGFIKNIEEKIETIKRYQSYESLESLYRPMQVTIGEMRNITKELSELTAPINQSLSHTLRQSILHAVEPLDNELVKRLEMTSEQRKELESQIKKLYDDQNALALKSEFSEHLEKIKTLMTQSDEPRPRCYICYAWPSDANKGKEYWVQPFLSILYDHLTAAGIRAVMDIRDNRPGESIYRFMNQYKEGNFVLLVGTESLLEKHESVFPHAVQTELATINYKSVQDQQQYGQSRIYPMLISGTRETAFPPRFQQMYSTVRSAIEPGYLKTVKNLLDWIFENERYRTKSDYDNLWNIWYEKNPEAKTDAQRSSVTEDSVFSLTNESQYFMSDAAKNASTGKDSGRSTSNKVQTKQDINTDANNNNFIKRI